MALSTNYVGVRSSLRVLVFHSGSYLCQDGFPARHWLDFHPGEADENKAVFVGHALVRGYKAYLDVKQPVICDSTCRQLLRHTENSLCDWFLKAQLGLLSFWCGIVFHFCGVCGSFLFQRMSTAVGRTHFSAQDREMMGVLATKGSR